MTAATYDGDSQRATATTGAGTENFVWNTVSLIPQEIMDSGNAYIYCGALAPAEQVNLSTGATTYLVTDSLGSVRGAVNSSGTLTGTTSYDAWGNPETTGGLTATTPFGYVGGYTDPTGLIYLLARYYDSATGQFTSLDPAVTMTLQPYSYADGDPISKSDPLGKWWTIYHYGGGVIGIMVHMRLLYLADLVMAGGGLLVGAASVGCAIAAGESGPGSIVAGAVCGTIATVLVGVITAYLYDMPQNDNNVIFYWHFWWVKEHFLWWHYWWLHWHYLGALCWRGTYRQWYRARSCP